MVTLEQIKLLETKVARTIEIVNRVTDENTFLKGKLESYQKRIDELEVLIQRFKEDQGRIEEGIVSALNRLNQFEEAIEGSLSPVRSGGSLEKPALSGIPAVEVAPPAEEPVGGRTSSVGTSSDSPVYAPAEEEVDEAVIFDDSEDEIAEPAEVLLEESLDISPDDEKPGDEDPSGAEADPSGDDEPAAELDIF
ncbi:hypothetical protein FACS1894124_7330 [Spirochaetia bacterium]|nr:hypothetical protein FACS1894124_7330 [Spirochaetia bacterium]